MCGLAAGASLACGGAAPTAPGSSTATVSTGSTTAASGSCGTFGNKTVTVGRTTAVFQAAPFNADELRLITLGSETNDPRFVYVWVKPAGSARIYAPADGVFIRIRHKVPNSQFNSEDWDLFFLAACDPSRPTEGDTIYRFNHITDPRADFKAAYAFGSLPAPQVEPTFIEYEERQVPTSNITVKAGELLGSTRGTPEANNFDFQVAINNATVCPFDPLPEAIRTPLRALLGPGPRVGGGNVPQAGYPCTGFGDKP